MLNRSLLSRTGSFRPENLGQNALAMIGNLCFTFFVLGVLIFTIIAATCEPEDPLFHPSTKITTYLTSTSNATFKSDDTVVKTGEDFIAPNQTLVATFINATDVEYKEAVAEQTEPSCEGKVDSPIDCTDPELFHLLMRNAIDNLRTYIFIGLGRQFCGDDDDNCDMAWQFRPKGRLLPFTRIIGGLQLLGRRIVH